MFDLISKIRYFSVFFFYIEKNKTKRKKASWFINLYILILQEKLQQHRLYFFNEI